jgi:hypothetical protein
MTVKVIGYKNSGSSYFLIAIRALDIV